MRVAHRTDAANKDLHEIAFQIGIESGRPRTAEAIVDALIDCCEQLAGLSSISTIGKSAGTIGAGVRLFHHRRWIIIFRYSDDGVIILRIVDGSQDYLSLTLD